MNNKAQKVVGTMIFLAAVSIGVFDRHEAIGLQAILERQAVQDQIQACMDAEYGGAQPLL